MAGVLDMAEKQSVAVSMNHLLSRSRRFRALTEIEDSASEFKSNLRRNYTLRMRGKVFQILNNAVVPCWELY